MYEYTTSGVCARTIYFDVEDDRLKNVEFVGGCHGNLQGISALVEGMTVEEIIKKLSGIKCGGKMTSCPDQLTYALLSLYELEK